ncbi:MAG: DUF507 family protein [Pseudomonadota bacterium]
MKLYGTKIPIIAREIVRHLTANGNIEVNNYDEAELDIQAVLREYLRVERDITNSTKDLMENRKLAHDQFGKTKRAMAEQKGFPLAEEGILFMCNQILETFMQSQFVEEIYASDADMRKNMKEILRRHMLVDEELDVEVRQRIKNLTEGSSQWDVEYGKVMEQLRHTRDLKD